MKVLTAVAAAERLGWGFRFETRLVATGPDREGRARRRPARRRHGRSHDQPPPPRSRRRLRRSGPARLAAQRHPAHQRPRHRRRQPGRGARLGHRLGLGRSGRRLRRGGQRPAIQRERRHRHHGPGRHAGGPAGRLRVAVEPRPAGGRAGRDLRRRHDTGAVGLRACPARASSRCAGARPGAAPLSAPRSPSPIRRCSSPASCGRRSSAMASSSTARRSTSTRNHGAPARPRARSCWSTSRRRSATSPPRCWPGASTSTPSRSSSPSITARRPASADGVAALRATLADLGVPPEGYLTRDGSGLSRNDYLSADALVATLEAAWRRPGLREPLLAVLPAAGVPGTLAASPGRHGRGRPRARQDGVDVERPLAGGLLSRPRPVSRWRSRS